MFPNRLTPHLELLTQEYVLVQAWKKTVSYIRRHNWYSDTLELDYCTVNLPGFIGDLRDRLAAVSGWEPDPLRIVPAPKGQHWVIDGNGWRPHKQDNVRSGGQASSEQCSQRVPLRPLAHVSLADQVAATAVMLCMADRVETLQGDPGADTSDADARRAVMSYGNRLVCENLDGGLRHCWGARRLYRDYYVDYRTFLDRPSVVAAELSDTSADRRAVIVHADLRQFYDRVRPSLLWQKLDSIARRDDDSAFWRLAKSVFHWIWDRRDAAEVGQYAKDAGISDFGSVALPQGLAAAGFFANVALVDFDDAVRRSFGSEISHGVRLADACRYVDDLRLVLVAAKVEDIDGIKASVEGWLSGQLSQAAAGLELSRQKTSVALPDGDQRPLVRQSKVMDRVQRAVSGGFDAIGAQEILVAVQGLLRAQERYSAQRAPRQRWVFAPVADVRDDRVARFSAARFRKTARSLRPLLSSTDTRPVGRSELRGDGSHDPQAQKTREELDEEVRTFALGLIERWLEDPSNVRLLRIALDLWPDALLLKSLLDLMRPFTERGRPRKGSPRVVWYCLAEILRAGAIETGFVNDEEALPNAVNINDYRGTLADEALRIASLSPRAVPWYLRQQALLFLVVHAPERARVVRAGSAKEERHYRRLLLFLNGSQPESNDEFATMAVLCRRLLNSSDRAGGLTLGALTSGKLREIAARDPSFAIELLGRRPELRDGLPPRVRDDLCLRATARSGSWCSLAQLVLDGREDDYLRSEPGVLELALGLLEHWPADDTSLRAITPNEVELWRSDSDDFGSQLGDLRIVSSHVAPEQSPYLPPEWYPKDQRWRYQIGCLLRFVLTGSPDFTRSVVQRRTAPIGPKYRPVTSHWFQRRYGLFNGQTAFGKDWLPISDWIERLLCGLLQWPGVRVPEGFTWVSENREIAKSRIRERLEHLKSLRGDSDLWLLPIEAPRAHQGRRARPLRACIVQTVLPTADDLLVDRTQSSKTSRQRHRNHLSAALAAVDRMLVLRDTHRHRDGRLDWLVLPELSVHPADVETHLVPFARKHRAIVLAGLTYQEHFSDGSLVNTALWVVPRLSPDRGLQIVTRCQGKKNLAPGERKLNEHPPKVRGFRPCQWLVGYEWSDQDSHPPLWLTAAVCYDATDLALAAALRDHSDVFAIPALNRDVDTFDQMALALHYHMFQLVVVVNNGEFGGSNAYWPKRERFERQVFHLHGQPQASIAFFEIDDIAVYQRRDVEARGQPPTQRSSSGGWKSPPAGVGSDNV